MSQQQRIDRIIEEVQRQVQNDVSALLGSPLVFSSPISSILSKEDCFADLVGKQILAHIDINGEVEGVGALLLGIRDAILLGGTLIMLPDAELNEVMGEENYTEDIADSYGEIANIIVGSCSKVFEESYPKSCRFVRKEVVSIKPAKVNPSDDDVLPCTNYYKVSFTLKLGEQDLGEMSFVLPAGAFDLAGETTASTKEDAVVQQTSLGDNAVGVPDVISDEPDTLVASKEEGVEGESVDQTPIVDVAKNTKAIDAVFATSFAKMGGELGMLLGAEVKVANMLTELVSKEQFATNLVGKQVVSKLEVQGVEDSVAYICVSLADAIYMGGVLIMLPPSELDLVVQEEEFDEDAQDAYGEIANIVSGIYTKEFGENHPSKTRFIRGEMKDFTPTAVDVESDEPIPNGYFYVHSMDIEVGEKALGRMQFLIEAESFQVLPSELLPVQDIVESGAEENANSVLNSPLGNQSKSGYGETEAQQTPNRVEETQLFDILLVSDNQHEAEKISAVAELRGLAVGCVGFNENVQKYFSPKLKAVCLVMSEVNEQSFGLAIKLSAGSGYPLIAAGPGWTKSNVIKAVKYGVEDILLTPAGTDDIEECLQNNIFV